MPGRFVLAASRIFNRTGNDLASKAKKPEDQKQLEYVVELVHSIPGVRSLRRPAAFCISHREEGSEISEICRDYPKLFRTEEDCPAASSSSNPKELSSSAAMISARLVDRKSLLKVQAQICVQ